MKPFRVHLAEQEEENEYKLCSVENIHTTEMVEKIRMALGRYGLISMEPAGVQMKINTGEDTKFPEYPFAPVFVTKIFMDYPLSSDTAVQSIALFTRISDKMLKFCDKNGNPVVDGADAEQHAHPIEADDKDAQAEVGDARVKSLVSDMMKDIAARRSQSEIEIPVYEGFTATHHDIEKMTNRKVRRGFYLAENHHDGTATITGPFKKMPDNFDYVDVLPKVVVVESNSYDNLTEYKVKYAPAEQQKSPSDAGGVEIAKPMTVELTDQDTGKTYTIAVKAVTKNAARTKAIQIAAQQTKLPQGRFIPTSPVADPSN